MPLATFASGAVEHPNRHDAQPGASTFDANGVVRRGRNDARNMAAMEVVGHQTVARSTHEIGAPDEHASEVLVGATNTGVEHRDHRCTFVRGGVSGCGEGGAIETPLELAVGVGKGLELNWRLDGQYHWGRAERLDDRTRRHAIDRVALDQQ
jgi:hypothetical protein